MNTTMPFDEALGYAFTLIIDAGYDDPEAYLKEKGILQQNDAEAS